MKVIVHTMPMPTPDDRDVSAVDEYDNADGWHIDQERQLHVKKAGGGNLAAYATGTWLSAREAGPA